MIEVSTPHYIPQWDGEYTAHIRKNIGLSFDDVLLIPQHGVLDHRGDADLSTELVKGISMQAPIVSAPMSSVTESLMTTAIHDLGGFGIIHRFYHSDPVINNKTRYNQARINGEIGGVALGLNDTMGFINNCRTIGVKVFCLDIAHAHNDTVIPFMESFTGYFPEASIIVGNIATPQAARFLIDLGADAVKVGIGPGAACTTRERTGFGVPQLTAIMEVVSEVKRFYPNIRVIADGGIKNSGDIVKALAAGSDSVMLGKLLAGANESPFPGEYWGMASRRVNGHRAPEGVEGTVPVTGSLEDTLKELTWGIRSGLSYGGARNLAELRMHAEFIRVAPGTSIESSTRI